MPFAFFGAPRSSICFGDLASIYICRFKYLICLNRGRVDTIDVSQTGTLGSIDEPNT